MMYLAAQTMFRSIPDAFGAANVTAGFNSMIVRRRLFYAGILSGHVPSALGIYATIAWGGSLSGVEQELVLRCLKDESKVAALGPKYATIIKAVKADAAGDTDEARTQFTNLSTDDLVEFNNLWRRKVEYLFAVDEERALASIILERGVFSSADIILLLQQLLKHTKSIKMQI